MKPGRNRPKPSEASAKPMREPVDALAEARSAPMPAAASSEPQRTSWRGLRPSWGISHHCASRRGGGARHQHDRDPLLGMVERQREPVDDQEADHAEQRRPGRGRRRCRSCARAARAGRASAGAPARLLARRGRGAGAADRGIGDDRPARRVLAACRRAGAATISGEHERADQRRRRSAAPTGRAAGR